MTITVSGKVSAPEGIELEVIQAQAGIEQNRFRAQSGKDVVLTVYGSQTLILREVAAGAELAPKPGEQRHGELSQTAPAPAKLEEGDMDPVVVELLEAEAVATDRVLDLAHQLIDADGDELQQTVYQELRQAVQAHIGAVDRLDAYQSGQAA